VVPRRIKMSMRIPELCQQFTASNSSRQSKCSVTSRISGALHPDNLPDCDDKAEQGYRCGDPGQNSENLRVAG
jgi:hypothetical protein